MFRAGRLTGESSRKAAHYEGLEAIQLAGTRHRFRSRTPKTTPHRPRSVANEPDDGKHMCTELPANTPLEFTTQKLLVLIVPDDDSTPPRSLNAGHRGPIACRCFHSLFATSTNSQHYNRHHDRGVSHHVTLLPTHPV